jgi:hypothetical protein
VFGELSLRPSSGAQWRERPREMIKGAFIINSTGKPRLLKCYEKLVSGRTRESAECTGSGPRGLCPPTAPAPHPVAAHMQTEDQQQALVREIFSLLSKRTDAVCNFLEGGR